MRLQFSLLTALSTLLGGAMLVHAIVTMPHASPNGHFVRVLIDGQDVPNGTPYFKPSGTIQSDERANRGIRGFGDHYSLASNAPVVMTVEKEWIAQDFSGKVIARGPASHNEGWVTADARQYMYQCSPNGKYFVCVEETGWQIHSVQTPNLPVIELPITSETFEREAAFINDGDQLLTSRDNLIEIYDIPSRTIAWTFNLPENTKASFFKLAPIGRRVLMEIKSTDEHWPAVLDFNADFALRIFPFNETGAYIDPTGTHFVSMNRQRHDIRRVSDGAIVLDLPQKGARHARIVALLNGSVVQCIERGRRDSILQWVNLSDGKVVREMEHGSNAQPLGLDTMSESGGLGGRVTSLTDGRVLETFPECNRILPARNG